VYSAALCTQSAGSLALTACLLVVRGELAHRRARRRTAGRAGHACSGPRRAGGGLLAEQPAGRARAGVLRRAAALRAAADAAGAAEAALTRRLQVAEAAVLGPLQAAAADGLARAPAGRACRVWVGVR